MHANFVVKAWCEASFLVLPQHCLSAAMPGALFQCVQGADSADILDAIKHQVGISNFFAAINSMQQTREFAAALSGLQVPKRVTPQLQTGPPAGIAASLTVSPPSQSTVPSHACKLRACDALLPHGCRTSCQCLVGSVKLDLQAQLQIMLADDSCCSPLTKSQQTDLAPAPAKTSCCVHADGPDEEDPQPPQSPSHSDLENVFDTQSTHIIVSLQQELQQRLLGKHGGASTDCMHAAVSDRGDSSLKLQQAEHLIQHLQR